MHDRRVGANTLVLGNQGALHMANMTWWDHSTETVWTQLTGEALFGPLEGTRLDLIPMSIVPWETRHEQHPDTLVLKIRDGFIPPVAELPQDRFIIGIELGGVASAYSYEIVSDKRVINDILGDQPHLIYADPVTRSISSYLRKIANTTLTFQWRNGRMVDTQTGTVWEPLRGMAIEGALEGESLLEVPYATSFLRNWLDFYPNTHIYDGS